MTNQNANTSINKLSDNQIKSLITYAPENHPDPSQFVNMVNKNVMGVDKSNRMRPIEDLFYFMQVAHNAGLDPTLKQIYAVYRYDKDQKKEVMSIQTGIDGFRIVAERTGNYGGSSDAKFEYAEGETTNKIPRKATVTVFKIVGEKIFEVTASAHWDEYYPGEKMGFMWRKMPHVMLSKVAEALALRKAFPVLSQVYVKEEMEQVETIQPTKELDIKDTTISEDRPATEEQKKILTQLEVEYSEDVSEFGAAQLISQSISA